MEALQTVLLVAQVFVAVTLIGFILIQHGKGADAGAAFGSGASSTVFGSQGSGNFLTRVTTILATIFLLNSLLLGYLATQREAPTSIMDRVGQHNKAALEAGSINVVEEPAVDDVSEAPASERSSAPIVDLPELPE